MEESSVPETGIQKRDPEKVFGTHYSVPISLQFPKFATKNREEKVIYFVRISILPNYRYFESISVQSDCTLLTDVEAVNLQIFLTRWSEAFIIKPAQQTNLKSTTRP